MAQVGWAAIWEAAEQLDTNICGISWNGFNVAGDNKSVEEVKRLMHLQDRLAWFEDAYRKQFLDHKLEARICWGFKSSIQLPWFMVWREYLLLNEVVFAKTLFSIG